MDLVAAPSSRVVTKLTWVTRKRLLSEKSPSIARHMLEVVKVAGVSPRFSSRVKYETCIHAQIDELLEDSPSSLSSPSSLLSGIRLWHGFQIACPFERELVFYIYGSQIQYWHQVPQVVYLVDYSTDTSLVIHLLPFDNFQWCQRPPGRLPGLKASGLLVRAAEPRSEDLRHGRRHLRRVVVDHRRWHF